jgi:hypothetical protein
MLCRILGANKSSRSNLPLHRRGPGEAIWQPKPVKIRKRRVYSVESLLRQKDKYGRPKWKDPEEEERKRLAKERNNAAYERLLQKEKEKQAELDQVVTQKEFETNSAWQVIADGSLYTGEKYAELNQAMTPKEPETQLGYYT